MNVFLAYLIIVIILLNLICISVAGVILFKTRNALTPTTLKWNTFLWVFWMVISLVGVVYVATRLYGRSLNTQDAEPKTAVISYKTSEGEKTHRIVLDWDKLKETEYTIKLDTFSCRVGIIPNYKRVAFFVRCYKSNRFNMGVVVACEDNLTETDSLYFGAVDDESPNNFGVGISASCCDGISC